MSKSGLPVPDDFPKLLRQIKDRIAQAQTRAILSVNSELIRLYWDIGRIIDARQRQEGWGAAVIPRLARELHNELPEEKGFSQRNIKYMIRFYREYVTPPIVQRPAAQLSSQGSPSKVQQPAAQLDVIPKVPQPAAQLSPSILWSIPWFHHVVLMEKIKDLPDRLWYMAQILANGWSRNILGLQISSGAHKRQGRAITNFPDRLPSPQSDLARQALKDPYIFDFLTLEEPFHERELETGLLRHVEKFLLELGQGFAFVGRQYHLEVGREDFYVDLLFYHLRLRCFIVIDLKKGALKAEYVGKMNFYCNLADDRLRHPGDQPTIGLILCQDRNRLVAEYALQGVNKAIGISEYQLTRALPANLRSALPTVEQIEAELGDPGTRPLQGANLPAKKKPSKRRPRK